MTSWLSRIRQTCSSRHDPVVPFTTLIQYWLILPLARLNKIPYFRANLAFVLLWFSPRSTQIHLFSPPDGTRTLLALHWLKSRPFMSEDAAAKRQRQLLVSVGQRLCGCAGTPCWCYSKSCHLALPTAVSRIVQRVALLCFRTDIWSLSLLALNFSLICLLTLTVILSLEATTLQKYCSLVFFVLFPV